MFGWSNRRRCSAIGPELLRSTRGSALIEMSLVLPVLLILALGIVDVSQAYSFKLGLQQAAQHGGEFATAAETPPADGEIRTVVAERAGVPASAVTIERFLECNYARAASETCASGVTSATYILIRVSGTYQPLFGATPFGSIRGATTVTGETTVRVQ